MWKNLIYNGIDYGNRYLISNNGNVYSKYSKRQLKSQVSKKGYKQVLISLGSNKYKKIYIHRAVACTYIPNPNNLSQINHIDGIKTHNYETNLEWVTPKENIKHSLMNNLQKKGENCSFAKLSQADIEYIRNNYKFRDKQYNTLALAKKFNVDRTTISKIIHYERWK